MTSGKRTPEQVRIAILRLASEKDLDGSWLLSYDEISLKLRIDRRIVSDEIRQAARHWWGVSRWRDDPSLA